MSVFVRPCPSVSVTSRSSIETGELIKMVVGMGTSFDLSHTLQSVLYENASNKVRTNTKTNLNTVIFVDLLEFDLLQVSAVFYWCNCWPKTSSNMIFRLCLSYCVRC